MLVRGDGRPTYKIKHMACEAGVLMGVDHLVNLGVRTLRSHKQCREALIVIPPLLDQLCPREQLQWIYPIDPRFESGWQHKDWVLHELRVVDIGFHQAEDIARITSRNVRHPHAINKPTYHCIALPPTTCVRTEPEQVTKSHRQNQIGATQGQSTQCCQRHCEQTQP
jgi:hypothetical protein